MRTRHIQWPAYHRIIQSAYPPLDLFDDIAEPQDWALLAAAESQTSPRLKPDLGGLQFIPPERHATGPGGNYLNAPFAHASADFPGRFHSGRRGAFYAADTFETALAEKLHHLGVFYRATNEAPGWISQQRELVGSLDARLVNITQASHKALLSPTSYRASQAFANRLIASGQQGVHYPSVRHEGGKCIAAFYPDVPGPPKQGKHLAVHWNGQRVDQIKVLGRKSRVFWVGG